MYATRFDERLARRLPPHRPGFDFKVDIMPGKAPPFGPLYRLSDPELKLQKEWIADELDKGWLRPSKSQAASPVMFASKNGGAKKRPCGDYRGLNSVTVPDRYPLPFAEQLLEATRGARRFTKLDLSKAFKQLRIAEGDEWKLAVRTPLGLYEPLVCPFGPKNCPGVFQRFMDHVLDGLSGNTCVCNIDDILIFDKADEEHEDHVKEVFQRLCDNDLFLVLEKYHFDVTEVPFIGFMLTEKGF